MLSLDVRLMFCFLTIVSGLLALWASPVAGQGFVGMENCSGCHDQPTEAYEQRGVTKFVSLTEYTTWQKEDKHSLAYKNLDSELGKQMGEILEINVLEDPQCLSCHATNIEMEDPDNSQLGQGISCEGCHGPGADYLVPHVKDTWRTQDAITKESKGMIDVRDPVRRARMCFSCHIGRVEPGESEKHDRFVTHDMFAAGHPPLPPIEIETFSQQMPRHWRYLHEKEDFKYRAELEKNVGHRPDDAHRAKSAILGGMIALQSVTELFLAHSKNKSLGEFALYDCSACHHDLKAWNVSWRQQRTTERAFAPGRPLRPTWTDFIADLGIRHLSDAAGANDLTTFQMNVSSLDRAITVRPFGSLTKVQESAEGLTTWLEPRLTTFASRAFDRTAAQEASAALLSASSRDYVDFTTARAIAWSLNQLLSQSYGPPPASRNRQPIEGKKSTVPRPYHDILEQLRQPLALDLPSGQSQQIQKQLPDVLDRMSEFDADSFIGQLKELRKITERQ